MKYLKEFETTAQYTAAQSSLILPNVSLITETNSVAYNPLSPTPSHEYVEIGGIKWATMNIGASSVSDYGLYFQWGDTQGYTADQVGFDKKPFHWGDYKYTNDGSTFTKYNSTDGKTVLDAEDDAATAAWGGNWRMPTTDEWQALGNAVNTAWTQVNGVDGVQCTDKTDSSKVLFFPAASGCYGGRVEDAGFNAYYWSSSLYNARNAYDMIFFKNGGVNWQDDNGMGNRYYGQSVRGVLASNS